MKSLILFAAKLIFIWLVLFALFRAWFIIYNYNNYGQSIQNNELAQSFVKALPMDVSAACYITSIAVLLGLAGLFVQKKWWWRLVKGYYFVILLICTFLNIGESDLYHSTGVKLNYQNMEYLLYPRESMAYAAGAPFLLLIAVIFICLLIGWFLFKYLLEPFTANMGNVKYIFSHRKGWAWKSTGVFFTFLSGCLLLGILFIGIRGGTGTAPMNAGFVYFSNTPFINHATLNSTWNFVQHVANPAARITKNQFATLETEKAQAIVDSLFNRTSNSFAILSGKKPDDKANQQDSIGQPSANTSLVLTTSKPNIVLLILESWTSDVIEALGGEKGITPNFNNLLPQGLLFDNIYASGDRTDKGLVAVLAGYPAQPTTAITTIPSKIENLPVWAAQLKKNGYENTFFYGGDIAYANYKSVVLQGQYQKIIDRAAFNESQCNAKWGAHDGALLDKVQQTLPNLQQPFLATVMTLSSHEPFIVPMPDQFDQSTEQGRFNNAMFYADKVLGEFLTKEQQQPWFNNTLYLLIADHGHRLPKHNPAHVHAKYRIPMLWWGGALQAKYKGQRITNIASQTDLAATILAQLHLEANQFVWSKNILSNNNQTKPFAFFCYNNGVGFVAPNVGFTFDNVLKKIIYLAPGTTEQAANQNLEKAQALQQILIDDYLKR